MRKRLQSPTRGAGRPVTPRALHGRASDSPPADALPAASWPAEVGPAAPLAAVPAFEFEAATLAALADLKPDPENRRAHNERNLGLITEALREVGPARSIVIDEADVVLAGNGVTEAAAAVGITRVRIVEPAPGELIAVRRRNLSPEQKRALALYDNRTAELATWDPEQVAADFAAGLPFEPWFSAAELATLVGAHPDGDEWRTVIGQLPNGERVAFQQMTFTLTDAQAAAVKTALAAAKAAGPFEETGNENANGNALARVCAHFLEAQP